MKVNFAILLLPAASAFNRLSPRHHHHSKSLSTGLGTAPYGAGNGTATFGSSGLLTAPTGTAGKAIYSTIVVSQGAQTQTIVESGSSSLNEAGASLPFASSCAQATVTVTEGATVTVTVSAAGNGTGGSGVPTQAPVPTQASVPTQAPVPTQVSVPTLASIPTQAPVPTQAGTSSPVDSVTASPAGASSAPPPAVSSAITLAGIGAEPSSSPSTSAVADTPPTVSAAPVVAPTSSTPTTVQAAATSAAASTPAGAAVSPAASGAKAAKRGIIASGADTNAIVAAFANTKVSWFGNWYSGPPPNYTPAMGMEYVPQLYSPKYITDGSWASNAKKGVAAGDKYFMSYGEPLHSGITADSAVTDWMANMEPYAAQGVKLGAPGNLQNTPDMTWLGEFLDKCETAGCTIGFVCVHWFWTPGPSGQQDFKNAVGNATSLAKGKPVWVDNFGANGDREDQIEFLKAIIPWLEDNDAIERYGYLAINRTTGGFLPETGDELSDLGQFYATF